MRRCSAATSATAGFVFALFLLREIVSLALGCFPGQPWLWRLSYALGYEFLPLLAVLRAQLGDGAWLTCLVLCALVAIAGMAFKSRSLFLSAVVIHSAALSVWFCWLISGARHPGVGASANISVSAWKLTSQTFPPSILTILAIGLLFACLLSHASYIGSLRAAHGTPRRDG